MSRISGCNNNSSTGRIEEGATPVTKAALAAASRIGTAQVRRSSHDPPLKAWAMGMAKPGKALDNAEKSQWNQSEALGPLRLHADAAATMQHPPRYTVVDRYCPASGASQCQGYVSAGCPPSCSEPSQEPPHRYPCIRPAHFTKPSSLVNPGCCCHGIHGKVLDFAPLM